MGSAVGAVYGHRRRIMDDRNRRPYPMQKLVYPAQFIEAKGGFKVTFPDFPKLSVAGDSFEAAADAAATAVSQVLEGLLAEGREIPAPSPRARGTHGVAPSARVQSAALFCGHLGGTKKADVVRALKTSWPRLRDLETAARNVSIDRADEAARALGYQLVLTYERIG